MDEIYEKTLLYDFYGELLTEHQKQIYEKAVFEDLSLSEIADTEGITRQGVHDIIRRCGKILADYEEKLHLVDKFMKNRSQAEQLLTGFDELIADDSFKTCKKPMQEKILKMRCETLQMIDTF